MAGGMVRSVQVVGGDPQGLPSFHLRKSLTVRLSNLAEGWVADEEALASRLEPTSGNTPLGCTLLMLQTTTNPLQGVRRCLVLD